MTHLEQLRLISDELLNEELDFGRLFPAIKLYHQLLVEFSGIDLTNDDLHNPIIQEYGKALGTSYAARCVDDILRTKRFVKGCFHAYEAAKASKNGPVRILYAGCGPYATLVLPLIARLSPADLQVSVLEINPVSLDFFHKVINHLGFRILLKVLNWPMLLNIKSLKEKLTTSYSLKQWPLHCVRNINSPLP